ncbi:MAG TPA: maltose/maltodextrin ABC transporter substrate-binding protein MalE [Piscinibacter sp.]|uniref:maltose/maltodextrin ABC transporter substrate-binding protein MalE n=1 Tax=Piscinibacter sp. TaxID=1903157 RepID=UPI001B52911F|nr:maltose/maltodextrin ABC transporter substrate-binding protein MalE [Piscinibacter sp.]MBK7529936.1 maltose/maltodextrin ABC transporter substrate-binding protein MalE [Piscinibacter sp.]MBL0094132.1 maltose/maltodextrin ABC transporter substrate-binding protein MalE [Piscinibacter sp.]MBP6541873.1 maltose/maltodextrin ABC transporter substrate-binding protein MalE [Piscinibacter sp.]HOY35496.1 maltose/maltodextrin ABC transporter substrate-binding protein MalE [Piscinibacter sp.]HPG79592.1
MKLQRQRIHLVAAAAALALGATLGGSAFASEPGKLLIWINGDKGYNGLQKIGDEFAKKTGVQVTVEHPEDAPGKFQQAAAAGKGPDIWIWPHDRIGEWIAGGLLQPVTPGKKVVADIDPLALKAFTVGGKTWGYPISIEAVALVYNKALVPTPPKTFDEVIALDKKLSAQGKKAILWDYNNTYFTWPLLAANGGYPFKLKADGTYDAADSGVANAGAVKGAEMLDKMIKSGVMPKGASYADMEAGMSQGKVAMMINGPWSWDNLKKSNIDFGVARIPAVGGKKAAPFVGVLGAMINKSSQNRDVAVEFIENYMLSVKGLKMINDDVPLGTPASKALYAELKSNPNIQATMASAQDGAPMPNNPEMGRFWSSMASALQNMTEGRQAPKEALDAAAKRIVAK